MMAWTLCHPLQLHTKIKHFFPVSMPPGLNASTMFLCLPSTNHPLGVEHFEIFVRPFDFRRFSSSAFQFLLLFTLPNSSKVKHLTFAAFVSSLSFPYLISHISFFPYR